jgi:hypothetical protein
LILRPKRSSPSTFVTPFFQGVHFVVGGDAFALIRRPRPVAGG